MRKSKESNMEEKLNSWMLVPPSYKGHQNFCFRNLMNFVYIAFA